MKTLPLPVPSPDVKRGGLCAGLAPLPRKKEPATETLTKEKKQWKKDQRTPGDWK